MRRKNQQEVLLLHHYILSTTTVPNPTLEQIKQIAKAQDATLVEYSIIYDEFKVEGKPQPKESQLYIWVIKPTGEILFQPVDLKPLWQQQNITLSNFVTDVRCFDNVNCLNRGSNFNLAAQNEHAKPIPTFAL